MILSPFKRQLSSHGSMDSINSLSTRMSHMPFAAPFANPYFWNACSCRTSTAAWLPNISVRTPLSALSAASLVRPSCTPQAQHFYSDRRLTLVTWGHEERGT